MVRVSAGPTELQTQRTHTVLAKGIRPEGEHLEYHHLTFYFWSRLTTPHSCLRSLGTLVLTHTWARVLCWLRWWDNVGMIHWVFFFFSSDPLTPLTLPLWLGDSHRGTQGRQGPDINNRFDKIPSELVFIPIIPNLSIRGGRKCQDLVRKRSISRSRIKRWWGGSRRRGSDV